jgi:hypothetical protein
LASSLSSTGVFALLFSRRRSCSSSHSK